MNHESTELLKPPGGEKTGEEKTNEEKQIVAATEAVLPKERVEGFVQAAEQYSNAVKAADVVQAAQTTLAQMETGGRAAVSSSSSSPLGRPRRPDAPVLQRRAHFQESSSSLHPTSPPASSNDVLKARANVSADNLRQLPDKMQVSEITRDQFTADLETYGTSFAEKFNDVFSQSGSSIGQTQKTGAELIPPNDVAAISDALNRLQSAASTTPISLAAFTAAASDLSGAIDNVRAQNLPLAATDTALVVLAMIGGRCGDLLKAIVTGQPVEVRTVARRAHDVAARLAYLGRRPGGAREDALRKAERVRDTAKVDMRTAGDEIAAAQKELAAIDPGSNPNRETTLRRQIASDTATIQQLKQRLQTQEGLIQSCRANLRSASAAAGEVLDRLAENPKSREWKSAIDDVTATLKNSASMNDQQRTNLITAVNGLLGTLDADFAALAKRLHAFTGDTAVLEGLISDVWTQTRLLDQLQNGISAMLASTPATAAVLDPLRARLQSTLAAMAAYLSQLVLTCKAV